MKWFSNGISSKEELKVEYRNLAKKHHPDMGGNVVEMQEINEEYDEIFAALSESKICFETIFGNVWKMSKDSRDFIVFLMRDEYNRLYGYSTKYKKLGFWGSLNEEIYPDDSWENAKEGFAVCKRNKPCGLCAWTVVGNNFKSQLPNYEEMSVMFSEEVNLSLERHHWERNRFRMIEEEFSEKSVKEYDTPYGSFYFDETTNYMYAANGDKCYTVQGKDIFSEPKAEYSKVDFTFLTYQDCTFDEFLKYHDVENESGYHTAMQMQERDADFAYSGIVSFMGRKKIIRIFQSKFDYTMKYGYFDIENLIKNLSSFSIEDIEEVQDFLDEINEDFYEKVKAKIKKGKLKIII